MLFKFKSKAAADLIMLEADARRLLQIMIGDDPVKGILPVQTLPDVLAKIDVAVQQDEAMRLARSQNAQQAETRTSEEEPEPALPAIRLAQRAAPMQQMIQRSIREESDIVWGV
ncbi:DUF1840 domain-containing protein [Limnohabitans radicicola]|uniref:DUF1840 domain-containing protein n=1 Tax=Limnohabitans radicicola TaxID=2771427 RepID=A0A927FHR7_9BURK|nr:DUF1840 domain-containing protein [Limnohabitans radicicola]MBD8051211.1 DUF1840 domain-containing protein [Limnohabitans radicicola]